MSDTPPNPSEIYQQLSRLAAWLCPEASDGGRVRIVIEVPTESGWERVTHLVRPVDTGELRVIDDPEAELTQMQLAVLQVLRDEMKPGDVWSVEEIARKAGYGNSGKLRDWVKLNAPALRIVATNRGWAKS